MFRRAGRFTRVLMRALLEQASAADGGAGTLEPLGAASADVESEQADKIGAAEACGRAVVLPTNFVFPLPNSLISADADKRRTMREALIVKESIAVHHWAGSWLKQHLGLPAWTPPAGRPRASRPTVSFAHALPAVQCSRVGARLLAPRRTLCAPPLLMRCVRRCYSLPLYEYTRT